MAKIDQKWRKLAKSKPFNEMFWNLVYRCPLANKNSIQSPIFDFCLFWVFFLPKTAKIGKKWRKLAKFEPFHKIFWNSVCRYFPTKENATKKLFFGLGLFWPKNSKNWQKMKKIGKIKTIWWSFLKLCM